MNKKTIIIGHKNPDTDSICSAIAYSEFKSAKGENGIIAGRAGNINQQTDFVLKYFKQGPPVFFADIYPRLSDIMVHTPITVNINTTILEVMRKFREKRIRFLPVVAGANKVAGAIVTLDLAERFDLHIEPSTARRIYTTLENMAFATDSRILVNIRDSREMEFSVFVGAMSEESFNRTIKGYDPSSLVIIVGDRISILKASLKKNVSLIIVTGGLDVSADIIEEARKVGVGLMVTPHDSASTAWLIKLSAPAGRFCSNRFMTASPKERVETVRRAFLKSNDRGIVIADENGSLKGVITKSNFLKTPDTKLILMDHNEFSQAVDGADQVEIVEVIDHHRIANFHTAMPISVTIQPVGSTCTLIAEKYREGGRDISKEIAGLLLSGIISDTITGRSPTTTDRDIEALQWLEEASGVKREPFSLEMFSVSSILGQKSCKEIIMNDFKNFNIGGQKIGIGQVEVVGFERFHKIKEGLMEELRLLRQKEEYALAGLMVTDITYEVTLFQVAADREIYNEIGLPELEKNIFEMKGVLSRKKQVVPYLFNLFAR